MSNIDFVLNYFNTEFTLDQSAQILQSEIIDISTNATAEYDIDVNMFRNVFRFWTDASDVDGLTGTSTDSNNNSTDVKYYVKLDNWDSSVIINPAHALVKTNGIGYTGDNKHVSPFDPDRSLVKHDFLRHISQQLFNTYLGVDLFTNEGEMTFNIAKQGHIYGWGANPDISGAETSIWKTLVDASNGETDSSGNYIGYYTSNVDGSANLTRELLGQLSSTTIGRERLSDIDSSLNKYSDGTYAIPFTAGDSVSIKVTLYAAPGQGKLTGVGGQSGDIPSRSYRIKIKLVDNALTTDNNIQPTDDKLYDGSIDVSNSYVRPHNIIKLD
jgi:hypothetical protein